MLALDVHNNFAAFWRFSFCLNFYVEFLMLTVRFITSCAVLSRSLRWMRNHANSTWGNDKVHKQRTLILVTS